MGKKLDHPRGLVSLSPSPRFMPPDWKPPAPAWSASFAQQTTPVVMAYFGTQFESHDHERPGSQMDKFLDCADAPANVESANFVDRAGWRNFLLSAYWTDPASYERWKDNSGFAAWWSDPALLNDRDRLFREIV